ncbi:MAG TPA: glycosyltransferase family 4 protein [Verrucomicrobiae bacterium]|jgi:glycosyltransferase involved in cell wall biosynthesis
MRVIHVITRLVVGGAQENTVATVLGLREKPGIDVQLLSGPTFGPEGTLETEVNKTPGLLTIVPDLVRPIHPVKDFRALKALEKLFRDQNPDVVHTHSGKAGILGRLAARRAGVPVIIHTIHGPSFGTFQNSLSNFVFCSAERYAAPMTTHFIVVAEAMKKQYLEAGIGKPEQYTKIFSGFPLEPFLMAKSDLELRKQLGFAPDDFVVGKIARLFKLKGHDDLLTTASELVRQRPKAKFLLIGDGEWRGRLEARAKNLGVDKHFAFVGLVPPEKVPRYIGIMDTLAHLSLREGLPRALPQALAAGKPVVAYDCDGAREICLDGQTGFLVQPGDLQTLKTRLLQLADDPTLREKFGKTGSAFVCENFAVEKMVDAIYNLYQKLAAESGIKP